MAQSEVRHSALSGVVPLFFKCRLCGGRDGEWSRSSVRGVLFHCLMFISAGASSLAYVVEGLAVVRFLSASARLRDDGCHECE